MIASTVGAQDAAPAANKDTKVETAKSTPNDTNVSPHKDKQEAKIKETSVEIDLDKEYWSYFYIPDFNEKLKEEKEAEKRLNQNILRIFKAEIEKLDTPNCLPELPNITDTSVRIKEIQPNNQWIQEVQKKLKHLKFTEYMYLVKYKNYLSYISFEVDPKLHLQSPFQVEMVIKNVP